MYFKSPWTCDVPTNQTTLSCNTTTDVCYEWLGECLTKCATDTDCTTMPGLGPGLAPFCNSGNGKCYNCLNNGHCKPDQNNTCGAQCIHHPESLENFCEQATQCSAKQSCVLLTSYVCNAGNTLMINYVILLLIFLFLL